MPQFIRQLDCEHNADIYRNSSHHGGVVALEEAPPAELGVYVSEVPGGVVVRLLHTGALDPRLDHINGVHGSPQSEATDCTSNDIVHEFHARQVLDHTVGAEEGGVAHCLSRCRHSEASVERKRIVAAAADDVTSAVDDALVLDIALGRELHLDTNILHGRSDEGAAHSRHRAREERVVAHLLVESVVDAEVDRCDEDVAHERNGESFVQPEHAVRLDGAHQRVGGGLVQLGVRLDLHLDRVEGVTHHCAGHAGEDTGQLDHENLLCVADDGVKRVAQGLLLVIHLTRLGGAHVKVRFTKVCGRAEGREQIVRLGYGFTKMQKTRISEQFHFIGCGDVVPRQRFQPRQNPVTLPFFQPRQNRAIFPAQTKPETVFPGNKLKNMQPFSGLEFTNPNESIGELSYWSTVL